MGLYNDSNHSSHVAKPKSLRRLVVVVGAVVGWIGLLGMFHDTLRSPNAALMGRQLTESHTRASGSSGASTQKWMAEGSETTTTTMLYGIFTTRGEVERRQLIRETILTTLPEGRLCSLQQHKKAVLDGTSKTKECRIIYTFVVGFYDEGDFPTEHVSQSDGPVALFPSKTPEHDIVFLNIKENMKTGKTPTWFKYASGLTAKYGIDYIAKADADTFMWMPSLYEFVQRDLDPAPHHRRRPDHRRIYGGFMVDSNVCGGSNYTPCKILFGKIYMAGMFYFISSDLAHYLNSDGIDRTYFVRHEDYDLGMRVLSHPLPVKLTVLNNGAFWHHTNATKHDEGWRRLWDMYKSGARDFELERAHWWPRTVDNEQEEMEEKSLE